MAYKEIGIHRQDYPRSLDCSTQKTERINPAHAVAISGPQSTNTRPEDLGRPAMGWMPRKKLMALVQQIDAELAGHKGE